MEHPDILLVTVDSLRADHVSATDPESPVSTPNLDQLGDSGVVYTDAIAQGPFTTFSMPSLFTARYPTGLNYVELSDGVVGVYPPSDVTTLPEQLSEAGYDTAGFHSNPLLSELFDFDRGFDAFEADLPFAELELSGRLKLLTNKFRRLFRKHPYLPAEAITDRAIDWLSARDDDTPVFCWVHYMDVHGPYQSKSGFTYYNKYRAERLWQKAIRNPDAITAAEASELRATYQEEVRYTDEQIGRLLSEVKAARSREPVTAVTSDHGDAFAEHGYYGHPHEVDTELISVPLLFHNPHDELTDTDTDQPTELVDVAPTLLDAAGIDVPESFEGVSLAGERDRDRVAVAEAEVEPEYVATFCQSDLQYIVDERSGDRYIIDRDTGDRVGATDMQTRDTDFEAIAQAHRGRPAATHSDSTEHDIDDQEVTDRLRRLGYME